MSSSKPASFSKKRLLLCAVGLIAVALLVIFSRDLNIVAVLQGLRSSAQDYFVLTAIVFTLVYLLAALTMLPLGAVLMTMGAGVIFGFEVGWAMASFASTFAALVGFLIARMYRDFVLRYFGKATSGIRRAFEKQGVRYLIVLRLIPGLPFAVINYGMGLTNLNWLTYTLVSWAAMLIATGIFVFAGYQIASLESLEPHNVLTPEIIVALLLMASLPWVGPGLLRVLDAYKEVKVRKHRRHDYDVAVIGAGAAGLSAAMTASGMGGRAVLIDADATGGECLNYGCVPTKTLLEWSRSASCGKNAEPDSNWAGVRKQVRRAIAAIGEHESPEYLAGKGVDFVQGEARFTATDEIEVAGRQIKARRSVIAAGAPYAVPGIAGLHSDNTLTPHTLWQRDKLGESLLVLGAGPSGCEFAEAFARLGYKVVLVDIAPRILPNWGEYYSQIVDKSLRDMGINIRTGVRLDKVSGKSGSLTAQLAPAESGGKGGEHTIACDSVLATVARKMNAGNALGLQLDCEEGGAILVDEYQRCSQPGIYAAGDCAGIGNTVAAGRAGRVAGANAMLGVFGVMKFMPRACPQAVYTGVELARVGVQPHEASDYEADVAVFSGGDRAVCADFPQARVELVHRGSKLLGGLACGPRASDQIAAVVASLGKGGMQRLTRAQAYPSWSYAMERAAHGWAVEQPMVRAGQKVLQRVLARKNKK